MRNSRRKKRRCSWKRVLANNVLRNGVPLNGNGWRPFFPAGWKLFNNSTEESGKKVSRVGFKIYDQSGGGDIRRETDCSGENNKNSTFGCLKGI